MTKKTPPDETTTNQVDTGSEKNSSFLLRLPFGLRNEIEQQKEKVKAKSLQALIIQYIVQGLREKGDYKPVDLFAKDLHVRTRAEAIGVNSASTALMPKHEQILRDLENQKLTSFAAVFDVALMSYRLLLDFALQAESSRLTKNLVEDFSNGLFSSAQQAKNRGYWGFAEALLVKASEIDPENTYISHETGIFLLKRFVRIWSRDHEFITDGVTHKCLIYGSYSHASVEDSDSSNDETDWARAKTLWEKLDARTVGEQHMKEEAYYFGNSDSDDGRLACWRNLAFVIKHSSKGDPDALRALKLEESARIERIKKAFNSWGRSFQHTREKSKLQQDWAEWFFALEIFWWLGYRNESFILANEARGFVSDEKTVERYRKLRLWDPATEYEIYLGDGTYYRTNKIEDFNEEEMERVIDLDPILGRPDGK